MKIFVLEFITSVGGVQTVYRNILPKLSHNHTIYFLDPYRSGFSENFSDFENIKVLNMPINSPSALGWSNSQKNRATLLFKYGFKYLRYLIKLIFLVRDNKFDMLYVSGKKELLFAYLLKIFTLTPYLYHCHGFAQDENIGFIHKLTLSKADKIICVSADTMRILEKKHINKDKMTVIYNGVDIDRISGFLQPDTVSKNCFKVVFAGAIQPAKGVHTLADAVRRIADSEGGISLDIFGEVTNKANNAFFCELSKIAENSNGTIRINGYSSNLLPELAKCDLLVLPSENEAFGMVLIEAMCLKKPVIGANVGGIPEIIEDKKTGLLFESKNTDDLYEKIKYLKNNREIAKKMGLSARERVETLFSLKTQVGLIDRIISITGSKHL